MATFTNISFINIDQIHGVAILIQFVVRADINTLRFENYTLATSTVVAPIFYIGLEFYSNFTINQLHVENAVFNNVPISSIDKNPMVLGITN